MSKRRLSIILVITMFFSCITILNTNMHVRAAGLSKDTATAITLDGQWSNTIFLSESDKEHWYKFTMDKDGIISFKFMSYDRLHYYLYNYDSSVTVIENYWYGPTGTSTSPGTVETNEYVVSKGDYYLKLTGSGNYKMVGFLLEYFDTDDADAISYDSPKVITMDKEYWGDFTATDGSADWYCIEIPSNNEYQIKLISYFNKLKYRISNFDLSNTIKEDNWYGPAGTRKDPATQIINVTLEKGKNYIKLSGGTGRYSISVSKKPGTTDDKSSTCKHEYKETVTDPTYFDKGYTTYECSICGDKYIDNYTDRKILVSPTFNKSATKNSKKTVKLNWNIADDATGYVIEYADNKKMKDSISVTVKGNKKTTYTIQKDLKKNKTYYFRVRAYVVSEEDMDIIKYSKWSGKYKIKIK